LNTLYSDNSSTNYWPDSNSVSTIGLNSTAISAFSTSYLKVCIVWWYDYTGTGSLVTANGASVIKIMVTHLELNLQQLQVVMQIL
jgi:hypothetical protein